MLLFVYGTLRKGGSNHGIIQPYIMSSENCVASGSLYSLGEYPVLVLSGKRLVKGELLELENEAEAIKVLDEFEGGEYKRAEIKVRKRTLGKVSATAYVYAGDKPPEGAVLVESGDWIEHIAGLK